jgi:hypothetical protein
MVLFSVSSTKAQAALPLELGTIVVAFASEETDTAETLCSPSYFMLISPQMMEELVLAFAHGRWFGCGGHLCDPRPIGVSHAGFHVFLVFFF